MMSVCHKQCVFSYIIICHLAICLGGPLQRLARGMECQRTTASNSNSEHCLLIYYHLIEIIASVMPLYRMNEYKGIELCDIDYQLEGFK